MIKKILSLSTLCLFLSFQNTTYAQNLNSEADFWIKGSNGKSAVLLNGNHPISDDITGAIMTPIGENHSNFYIVFQSKDSHEVDLADLNFKCYQQKITTQNINSIGLDVPLMDKIQTGAIVKYGFNIGEYDTKDTFFLMNNDHDQTYIYEIIYFNQEFTDLDHKHLQTYLSLKYGISLIDVSNYLSNDNQVLWNPEINFEYNKNITGIGVSDYFDLNQTQSVNSVDKLISIQSNSLANEEYIFVGNNGQSNRFVQNQNEKVLEKKYIIQTKSKTNENISLSLDVSLLENFDASKNIYLNLNNENKISGKLVNNKVIFNDIQVNSNKNGLDYFTISYDVNTFKAELADAWFLNDRGEITIKPKIETTNDDKLEVSWYFNAKLVGNKKDLTVNKPGNYEMKITSNNTTNSYQTTVYNKIENIVSNEIKVYPNPAVKGEDFKISYNLASESNVDLYIYQMDGKMISHQELGRFSQQEHNIKLENSGVYLIISKINGKANINKIIVK